MVNELTYGNRNVNEEDMLYLMELIEKVEDSELNEDNIRALHVLDEYLMIQKLKGNTLISDETIKKINIITRDYSTKAAKKRHEEYMEKLSKTYYITDYEKIGLTFQSSDKWDYVRLSDNSKGTPVKFEQAEGGLLIKMTKCNYPGYDYLTKSSKNWVYLDKRENATPWILNIDTLQHIYTEGGGEHNFNMYFKFFNQGGHQWLGIDRERNSFDVVPS
ncbi:hypothetical protein [Pseudalkalibacillus hwajinpoensis]